MCSGTALTGNPFKDPKTFLVTGAAPGMPLYETGKSLTGGNNSNTSTPAAPAPPPPASTDALDDPAFRDRESTALKVLSMKGYKASFLTGPRGLEANPSSVAAALDASPTPAAAGPRGSVPGTVVPSSSPGAQGAPARQAGTTTPPIGAPGRTPSSAVPAATTAPARTPAVLVPASRDPSPAAWLARATVKAPIFRQQVSR